METTRSSATVGVTSRLARTAFEAEPLLIMQTATAIARDRGQLPGDEVTAAARALCGKLADVEIEKVRDELEACLVCRDVDTALQWLFDIGVIELLLPELSATVSLTQEAGRRHKDVWEHTKLVVKQAVPRPAVRWAALLHDIGKVPTRTFTKKGVHFPRPRRGRRPDVRQDRPADPVRQADAPQDPLLDQASLAVGAVLARLDRQRRAPLRSRDARAPHRSARPQPRRHHVQAAGAPAVLDPRRSPSSRVGSTSATPRTPSFRRWPRASATR